MKHRAFFSLAALLFLLAPLTAGFGPPRQSDNPITITMEAGYGSRFRADQWLPLLLTLANDGPSVSGALRVRSENNTGLNATTYSTPIDLPQQSRKQVFLYVSLEIFARSVLVELVSTEGDVLQTVATPLIPAEGNDLLSAVVTDSPTGSIDLSSIRYGSGSSYQTNWSIENIPTRADALLGLNVMFFSDVDTGRLSVQQRQAVVDWVLAGGHLIVSGGPNYRLTTTAFADLLPVAISGTTTTGDLTPLAEFAGRYDESLAETDVILATGDLREGAEVLVAVDGQPVLTRRAYGEGLVDYLAADPGLAPFRRWRHLEALWGTLVLTPHQLPSWSAGFQDWQLAKRVIQQAPGFDLPSALEMVGLLAVYIIVIGPVNYVVLRLLGRREWAWFTIPLLVVTFSVLAYFTGFSLRGTRATVNTLSVVQVWPDSDRAQVDGLIGVLSPRRTTYNIAVAEGLTLRTLPEESGGFNPVVLSTQIEQSTVDSARDVLVDASLIAGFATTGFVADAPQIDGRATLTYGNSGNPRVSGTVRNTTGLQLENAVALVNGGFVQLGTLEPGDSTGFDLPVSGFQSAPLSVVQRQQISFNYEAFDLTVQDVMGNDYNAARYYARSPNLRERQLRQRQDFLTALATDSDFSGGRGDRVYVLGWSADSPVDITLEGAAWLPDDMTLYIFELPVEVIPAAEEVTIPPQLSTWLSTASTTVTGAQPYNLSIAGGEQASFRFMPLPSAHLSEVTRIDLTARRNSPALASIYLWNWHSEAWDKLEVTAGVRHTPEDSAPYVGPGNAVDVLIIPNDANGFVSFAQVDVTWHGTMS